MHAAIKNNITLSFLFPSLRQIAAIVDSFVMLVKV